MQNRRDWMSPISVFANALSSPFLTSLRRFSLYPLNDTHTHRHTHTHTHTQTHTTTQPHTHTPTHTHTHTTPPGPSGAPRLDGNDNARRGVIQLSVMWID